MRVAALGAVVAVLTLVPAAQATIATRPLATWQTNGRVNAIMQVGGVTYVGGKFTQVSSDNGAMTATVSNLAAFNSSGNFTDWAPLASNTVKTIETDGSGNIIVGGSFNKINGAGRPHIAEIDTAGHLIPKTTFAATADGDVQALARNGSTLYMGGQFANVDGGPRAFLAAVSLTDGSLMSWNPFVDGRVDVLALGNGGDVVAGGFFLNAGTSTSGQAALAAFDPTGGALQSGYASPTPSGVVSMAEAVDGSIFTGHFNNRLQRFDPSGSPTWHDTTDGNVQAMTISDGELIAGGHFGNFCVGGTCSVRHHIAAVNPANGSLDGTWAPNVNSTLGVFALADTTTGLALGGDFTSVGGFAQDHLAFLPTGNSIPIDSAPPAIGTVPDAILRKATTISTGHVPLLVRWTATDASGVCTEQLQRSVNGGTFAHLALASTTATSLPISVLPGTTTRRYRVQATDCVGNVSPFVQGPSVRLTAFQDKNGAIDYTRAWTKAGAPRAYGGTVHNTGKAGASATFRFTGRQVAWVAARSSTHGSARVYLDGHLAATVNLHSTTAIPRRIVFAHLWKTDATHTVKIVCTGTSGHPTVGVDAILSVR